MGYNIFEAKFTKPAKIMLGVQTNFLWKLIVHIPLNDSYQSFKEGGKNSCSVLKYVILNWKLRSEFFVNQRISSYWEMFEASFEFCIPQSGHNTQASLTKIYDKKL